jgi:hypothetical protein
MSSIYASNNATQRFTTIAAPPVGATVTAIGSFPVRAHDDDHHQVQPHRDEQQFIIDLQTDER